MQISLQTQSPSIGKRLQATLAACCKIQPMGKNSITFLQQPARVILGRGSKRVRKTLFLISQQKKSLQLINGILLPKLF